MCAFAEIKIERMSVQHLEQAASVHIAAFPGFFITSLGYKFVRELYMAYACDKAAVALIATDEMGMVLGAILGAIDSRGFYRRLLLRRWWKFGIASAVAVWHRPSIMLRLLRALKYRGDQKSGTPGQALLSSIAVAPWAQGRGVGTQLIVAWISAVQRTGVCGCYLTTDACENEGVNLFYSKHGWRIEHSFKTPEGRSMNYYVLRFN